MWTRWTATLQETDRMKQQRNKRRARRTSAEGLPLKRGNGDHPQDYDWRAMGYPSFAHFNREVVVPALKKAQAKQQAKQQAEHRRLTPPANSFQGKLNSLMSRA